MNPKSKRILAFTNILSLKRTRTSPVEWTCELCGLPIAEGEEFRGDKKKAHEICFKATVEAYKK